MKSKSKQLTHASKSKESIHTNKIFTIKSLVHDETQCPRDQCGKSNKDRVGGTSYTDNLLNEHDLVQVTPLIPSRVNKTVRKGPI